MSVSNYLPILSGDLFINNIGIKINVKLSSSSYFYPKSTDKRVQKAHQFYCIALAFTLVHLIAPFKVHIGAMLLY